MILKESMIRNWLLNSIEYQMVLYIAIPLKTVWYILYI
jgi:hypothetical protein